MNGNLDFLLGKIVEKLDINEIDHKEMKNILKEMSVTQSIVNNRVTALETKAKIWGGIMGVITGTIVAIIGWFIKP